MRVIETSLDEDLSLFCGYLWQQRVVHRVFEERGAQVLEVADAAEAGRVEQAYQAWRSGVLRIEAVPRRPGPARWPAALRRYAGLSLLVGLAVIVFPFSVQLTEVVGWLSLVDPRGPYPPLLDVLAEGRVWRWFTPVFLHFSVMHLAFNCAVIVELGRRVEDGCGSRGLWLLVLAVGIASNLAQYGLGVGGLFGGLSGVAYGLLGFVVTRQRLAPDQPAWQLRPEIAVGLLVFLVLFSTGVTEAFGLLVANVAHWAGLATGVLAGFALGRRGALA